MKNPYRAVRPCAHCPFRTDVEVYLRADRAREIADSLRQGSGFPCHETTASDPEDDSSRMVVDTTIECAGALIVQEKAGQPNQQMRIAERLGIYDPSRLDMEAPVPDSLSAWVRRYVEVEEGAIPTVEVRSSDGTVEVLEFEHCGVVDTDCEDPAGYGFGSGADENSDTPTCNPLEDICQPCGTPACPACRVDNPDGDGYLCVFCAEGETEEEAG